jgi:hypothetical protein
MSKTKIYGLLALVVAVACQEQSPELQTQTTEQFAIDKSVVRPSEDFPLEVAEANEHFSGYYCSQGDLFVGVTAAATQADINDITSRVRAKGVPFYCRNRDFPTHEPQIMTVRQRYSFLQLRAWRDAAGTDFFANGGAIRIGLRYAKNKIVAKVDPGYEIAKKSTMNARGVPDDAVEIIVGERGELRYACPPPSYSSDTPNGCFRPIPGGVAMDATRPGSSAGEGPCTITIAGRHLDFAEDGWVTAAHCFNRTLRGQVGAKAYQFEPIMDQFIGLETIDATGWPCAPFQCKHSDSAWIRRDGFATGSGQRGQILRTQDWTFVTDCCSDDPLIPSCSSCISSSANPRFQVYGTVPLSSVEGMQVDKIGRSTGWSTGYVTDTCEDMDDGQGNLMKCNATTSALSQVGDSGAPIFYWWSSYGVNTVELVGVLWTGGIGWTGFSPWAKVALDLGNIDVKFTPSWDYVPSQTANDIGVGANDIAWVTTNTVNGTWPSGGGYTIKKWDGITWSTIGGGALRLAVDPSGNAWVVNTINAIWRWNGSAFGPITGSATDIGIGANGAVWKIGTAYAGPGGYEISKWNGSSWTTYAGAAVRIAVDPSGNPWVVASDHTIWRMVGSTFYQVAGAATDIGIGSDGMVWILGTNTTGYGYDLYWWSGINWVLTVGSGTAVSVQRGGRPWLANLQHQLWKSL